MYFNVREHQNMCNDKDPNEIAKESVDALTGIKRESKENIEKERDRSTNDNKRLSLIQKITEIFSGKS